MEERYEDSPRIPKFLKDCEALTALGIRFRQDYEYRDNPGGGRDEHLLPFIVGLQLPFTAEEWCHLCMSEGYYYIGGCCGNSSYVQDLVNEVFRFESGWIKISTLAEIAEARIAHADKPEESGFSDAGAHTVSVDKWESLDPWQKMACIWHLVKDHWVPQKPDSLPSKESKMKPIDEAGHILSSYLGRFNVCDMFDEEDVPGDLARIKATKSLFLYRILPALKTLWEGINTLNPGSFEGFAIVHKGKERIAQNGSGLCVYPSRDDAEKMMNQWRESQKQRKDRVNKDKPIDELVVIERVKISMEEGLKFPDRVIESSSIED